MRWTRFAGSSPRESPRSSSTPRHPRSSPRAAPSRTSRWCAATGTRSAPRSTSRWSTASPTTARCGRGYPLDRRGAELRGWNGDSAFTVIVPVTLPTTSWLHVDAVGGHRGLALGGHRRAEPCVAPRRSRSCDRAVHRGQRSRGGLRHPARLRRSRHRSQDARVAQHLQLRGARSRRRGAAGLAVAIEPMVVIGDQQTFVEDDGWTVSTLDGTAGSHGNIASPCMMAASGC